MSNALALKIELAARATVPAGVTAVLMLLGSIAMNGTHVQVLEPVLAFASIYYWTLYRPDLPHRQDLRPQLGRLRRRRRRRLHPGLACGLALLCRPGRSLGAAVPDADDDRRLPADLPTAAPLPPVAGPTRVR
jgi:hypothetical protein